MRYLAWLVGLGTTAAPAAADTTDVIGGSNAPQGMWPDAAAMMYGGEAQCSGTLVAPTVVLTAGHCADPSEGPPPDHVLVGTASLDDPQAGETIAVASATPFPNWQTSVDITVVVLAQPASEPPRAIATGWARPAIANGAAVELVGFGTIDKTGTMQIPALQEAPTTITDFDCSQHPADCTAGAMPDGELGAGGMGIDTCPGDSGGPMYVPTSFGTFLAGVTSRGYMANVFACGEGGIYERPDHVIDWIEQTAGGPVTRGPEPSLDAPLEAARDGSAEATIAANDPASDAHHFAIKTQPAHGSAAVRDDGTVRVCIGSDAPAGSAVDRVVVTITDVHDPARALDDTLAITVDDATDTGPCDPGFGASGGCCDSGGRGDARGTLVVVLVALSFRRRRR